MRARLDRVLTACLAFTAAAALLAGCSGGEEAAAESHYPSTVEEVDGADVKRVTLTDDGASRISLETVAAQAAEGLVAVPYAALIYDGVGVPWVYVLGEPLTFMRHEVVVDRVEGEQALVSQGVRAGDLVATVGAAEVYGTELGIEGDH